jgi:hypothetical protein
VHAASAGGCVQLLPVDRGRDLPRAARCTSTSAGRSSRATTVSKPASCSFSLSQFSIHLFIILIQNIYRSRRFEDAGVGTAPQIVVHWHSHVGQQQSSPYFGLLASAIFLFFILL